MRASDVEEAPAQLPEGGQSKELERNFTFWSLCGVGLMTGSTWPSLGGSIVVALYNGGAPGAIYELIATSIFYWIIAACIAELASAIPSSAGVYHFAAVSSGPKNGRMASWYTGWFNALAWTFGAASVSAVLANQILVLYQLFHDDYAFQRWHLFIVYLAFTFISCCIVLFANRILPVLGDFGAFIIIIGFAIVVIVCAVMPSRTGAGYAPNHFVWKDWENLTGYSSNGFVFLAGMLNGAYAVGTPDCLTHLAEEIPQPQRNIPKAIAMQMGIGFITALGFLITVFYAVNDSNQLFETPYALFPMAEVYLQATGSKAGAAGLIVVMIIPGFCMNVGCYLTASRMVWTLARDHGTPFSDVVGRISPRWGNPFAAVLVCGGISTIMSFIYLGSSTAFNAFVGSFVCLTTLSYLGAILPYLLTRRKYVTRGWFRMPEYVFVPLAVIACLYIVTFVVIFCFPAAQPVDSTTMNYTCVIIGGFSILMAVYWFTQARHHYKGPELELLQQIRGVEEHGGAPDEYPVDGALVSKSDSTRIGSVSI